MLSTGFEDETFSREEDVTPCSVIMHNYYNFVISCANKEIIWSIGPCIFLNFYVRATPGKKRKNIINQLTSLSTREISCTGLPNCY